MSTTDRQRFFFFIGVALMAVGILCNEWVLSKLFSPDGDLLLTNRIIIGIFDVFALCSGVFVVLFRRTLSEEHFFLSYLKSHPRFGAFVFGTVFSTIAILCVEAVFAFLLLFQKGDNSVREGDYAAGGFFIEDSVLGYKPKPGTRVSSILKRNGKTVYDVVYTIDENGRRSTPVDGSKQAEEHALFFGCSFTFGEGVNDDQTLPYYFGRLSAEHRPYNYGFSGYGPQEMLAKMESGTLSGELESQRGFLVYTYLVGHEERAVGSMQVYNGWGLRMPYYAMDANGNLSRRGDFTTGRPVRSLVYKLLGKSRFLKFFNFNYPFRMMEADYMLTARIIEESSKLYSKIFGNNRFYVIIFPTAANRIEILPHLKKARIKYFDYSHLYDTKLDENIIVGEGHPSPRGYATVAKRLFEDISKIAFE